MHTPNKCKDAIFIPLKNAKKMQLTFWARRMVRQDSQLWSDLHQGMLTTGKLNSCLGFYEPMAAKRLGIGGGFVSHRALCSAYHHLQQPVYVPPAKVRRSLCALRMQWLT